MTDPMCHPVNFSPNQTMPPGYRVEWWEYDEHYRWVIDENTYGVETCCRYQARRGAWAHYRANA